LGRVNILKQIKASDGRWRLVAIPRKSSGGFDWTALPEGRYYIEWYERGRRRRQAAGATVADAQEAVRRKKHTLEGRALGVESEEEVQKKTLLHVAAKHYLASVEVLKKPNTHRKYKAVLDRFVEFMPPNTDPRKVKPEDLNDFIVMLRGKLKLDNNTVNHQMIIVAQFLKRNGRGGVTSGLDLPKRSITLPREYGDADLKKFFKACSTAERALFSTFLFSGFREQEVMNLVWTDINFDLSTIRVTAKPEYAFTPKTWEEREVPVAKPLVELLRSHPRHGNSRRVFPSPTGNREQHMLDHCKAIAKRAKLDSAKFDLKTFRSTYATRMLRAGFDVRTVQHWMGHRSLETTMRYLAPARDVHEKLDRVQIAGVLETEEQISTGVERSRA
jgi:integrase/recombinase XerD